jgi:uncharacterized protein
MSSRLGRGLAFPPMPVDGSLAWAEGADCVTHAIRDLLLTEPGERIGRPTYGVGLRQFLFAPNTVSTRTRIQRTVTDAIARHEGRAQLRSVEVLTDSERDTVLQIHIAWRLVGDVADRSLVYPFYLDKEA